VPPVVVRPQGVWFAGVVIAAAVLIAMTRDAATRVLQLEPMSVPLLAFAALFAVGYTVAAIVHELGHAVARRVVGLDAGTLVLGMPLAIHGVRRATNAQQLLISPAGGLLQAAFGALLIAITGLDWQIVSIIGVAAVVDGLVNALLPMGRRSDAWKLWRAVSATVRGGGDMLFRLSR